MRTRLIIAILLLILWIPIYSYSMEYLGAVLAEASSPYVTESTRTITKTMYTTITNTIVVEKVLTYTHTKTYTYTILAKATTTVQTIPIEYVSLSAAIAIAFVVAALYTSRKRRASLGIHR